MQTYSMPLRLLVTNFIFSSVGNVAAKAAFFLGLIICARTLSSSEFGMYSLIHTFIVTIGGMITAGSALYLSNRIPDGRHAARELLGSGLFAIPFLALLSAVVLFMTTGGKIPAHSPAYIYVLAAGSAVAYAIDGVMAGALQGLERFSRVAMSNCMKAAVYVSLVAILLVVSPTTVSATLALAVATLVAMAANSVFVFKSLGLPVWPSLPILRDLAVFALPIVLTNALVPVSIWYMSLLLVAEGGLAEVAVYNAYFQLAQILIYVAAVALLPLVPRMAMEKARGSQDSLDHLNVTIPVVVAFMVCFGVALSPVDRLVFGELVGGRDRALLVLAMLFSFLSIYKQSLFRKNVQIGKLHISLINNVLWLAIFVGGNAVSSEPLSALSLMGNLCFAQYVSAIVSTLTLYKSGVIDGKTAVGAAPGIALSALPFYSLIS